MARAAPTAAAMGPREQVHHVLAQLVRTRQQQQVLQIVARVEACERGEGAQDRHVHMRDPDHDVGPP